MPFNLQAIQQQLQPSTIYGHTSQEEGPAQSSQIVALEVLHSDNGEGDNDHGIGLDMVEGE